MFDLILGYICMHILCVGDEVKALNALLASHNRRIKDVASDGNCMYYALADQLQTTGLILIAITTLIALLDNNLDPISHTDIHNHNKS